MIMRLIVVTVYNVIIIFAKCLIQWYWLIWI